MSERVLVPIDQEMQVKPGWSKHFGDLDMEFFADNKNAILANHDLLKLLPVLGGRVLKFTAEVDASHIPSAFRNSPLLDVSLGAGTVRMTNGLRIARSLPVSDDVYSRTEKLSTRGRCWPDETWIFAADSLQTYVPPEPVEPKPPVRLRDLIFGRRS